MRLTSGAQTVGSCRFSCVGRCLMQSHLFHVVMVCCSCSADSCHLSSCLLRGALLCVWLCVNCTGCSGRIALWARCGTHRRSTSLLMQAMQCVLGLRRCLASMWQHWTQTAQTLGSFHTPTCLERTGLTSSAYYQQLALAGKPSTWLEGLVAQSLRGFALFDSGSSLSGSRSVIAALPQQQYRLVNHVMQTAVVPCNISRPNAVHGCSVC